MERYPRFGYWSTLVTPRLLARGLRRTGIAAAAAALLGTGVLAAPAMANPNATAPYGTFTCSDGRTVDIFGMDVPHFPIQVGFIDGKAVVARWFAGQDSGVVTINDGPGAGNTYSFDVTQSGPANRSHRPVAPDLSRLASCSSEDSFTDTGIVDADFANFAGIPPAYIGAEATTVAQSKLTVWINPLQLSTR